MNPPIETVIPTTMPDWQILVIIVVTIAALATFLIVGPILQDRRRQKKEAEDMKASAKDLASKFRTGLNVLDDDIPGDTPPTLEEQLFERFPVGTEFLWCGVTIRVYRHREKVADIPGRGIIPYIRGHAAALVCHYADKSGRLREVTFGVDLLAHSFKEVTTMTSPFTGEVQSTTIEKPQKPKRGIGSA